MIHSRKPIRKIKTFMWMREDKYREGRKENFIYPDKEDNDELDMYLLDKLNKEYKRDYKSIFNIVQFSEYGKTYDFVDYMEILSKYMMTYKNRKEMYFDKGYLLLELNIPVKEMLCKVYDYHQYIRIEDLMKDGYGLRDSIDRSVDEKYPLYMYLQLGMMVMPYIKSRWVGTVRNLQEVQTEVHHNMLIDAQVRLFLEQKLNKILKNKYYDSQYYDRYLSGYYDGKGAGYSYIIDRPIDGVSKVEKII